MGTIVSNKILHVRRRLGIGRAFATGVLILTGLGVFAHAQDAQTVERTAKGSTAKPIRVGVYLNVQPDCSSGVLPTIRLLSPPANGTVEVKRGKVTATNYKQCLALEVPGYVAFYKSKTDFIGVDVVTLEVKYPNGRTEVQKISVTVGDGKGGRSI